MKGKGLENFMLLYKIGLKTEDVIGVHKKILYPSNYRICLYKNVDGLHMNVKIIKFSPYANDLNCDF